MAERDPDGNNTSITVLKAAALSNSTGFAAGKLYQCPVETCRQHAMVVVGSPHLYMFYLAQTRMWATNSFSHSACFRLTP